MAETNKASLPPSSSGNPPPVSKPYTFIRTPVAFSISVAYRAKIIRVTPPATPNSATPIPAIAQSLRQLCSVPHAVRVRRPLKTTDVNEKSEWHRNNSGSGKH